MRKRIIAQPIFRLLVAGFVVVALLPLTIVSVQTYRSAWTDAWREVTEKHRLLALNLAAPIANYVQDHVDTLHHLADQIVRLEARPDASPVRFIDEAFEGLAGFRAISLLQPNGVDKLTVHREIFDLPAQDYSDDAGFVRATKLGAPDVSQVTKSRLDGAPTVVMIQPVLNNNGILTAVIRAELQLELIEKLRSQVRFGKQGHAVVVDAEGKALAHPNPDWAAEMRDLSQLAVVGKLMQGGDGVTEFNSPFLKEVMVAGYAAVPGVGWGIMVPQPKSEIEAQVRALLFSHFLWAGLGLLLALGVAIRIARWITRPINQLAQAANSLTEHKFTGELPDLSDVAPHEVRQLGKAFHKLVAGLQKSRTYISSLNYSLKSRVQESTEELVKTNERLEALVQEDHLTDLFNRRYFESELRRLLEDAKTNDTHHALLYLDLDRFKLVNDNYGHEAGDELLRQYAELLKSRIRHDSDSVARIGGDEFAILLDGCSVEEAEEIAEQLRADVAKMPFRWEQDIFRLTVSVGIVMLNADSREASDVLRAADRSCHSAKATGRNQVKAGDGANISAVHNIPSRWLTRISRAFENGDFALYCQPIVRVSNAQGMTRANYEILLRYSDDEQELTLPGAFLPTAERFNLMPQIDRWVIQTAANWYAGVRATIDADSMFFVNLSAQSLNDNEFADYIKELFSSLGVPPDRFCFEITETEVLTSLEHARRFMTTLKQIGCKFALDDFGTGMSSFVHLRELPIDVLKIDGSFVKHMDDRRVDAAVVRSIVGIAHSLDIQTVAESVENENILRQTMAAGVDYVQGFGVQEPVPLESIGAAAAPVEESAVEESAVEESAVEESAVEESAVEESAVEGRSRTWWKRKTRRAKTRLMGKRRRLRRHRSTHLERTRSARKPRRKKTGPAKNSSVSEPAFGTAAIQTTGAGAPRSARIEHGTSFRGQGAAPTSMTMGLENK